MQVSETDLRPRYPVRDKPAQPGIGEGVAPFHLELVPEPAADSIRSAQSAVIAFWEDFPPDTACAAVNVVEALRGKGHTLHAAFWAIYRLIEDDRLNAFARPECYKRYELTWGRHQFLIIQPTPAFWDSNEEAANRLLPGSRDESADAESDKEKKQGDTKGDKKKLSPRGLTPQARACARLFKAKRKADPKIALKAVIDEYLQEHHGSFSSIKRILSDNPQEWKPDAKGDTQGTK